MGHVSAPKFDSGVVAAAGDQLGVDQVEVDAPAALLVLLPHRALRVRRRVPDDHRALVVAAGQRALVEAAPRDAGDLARANHLRAGVVDVHHVLQHHVVVVDLDPLGHASDGKELLVFVKLDAGYDGAVVEHVRGVGQSCERSYAAGYSSTLINPPSCLPVVSGEGGETGPKLVKTTPPICRITSLLSARWTKAELVDSR